MENPESPPVLVTADNLPRVVSVDDHVIEPAHLFDRHPGGTQVRGERAHRSRAKQTLLKALGVKPELPPQYLRAVQ